MTVAGILETQGHSRYSHTYSNKHHDTVKLNVHVAQASPKNVGLDWVEKCPPLSLQLTPDRLGFVYPREKELLYVVNGELNYSCRILLKSIWVCGTNGVFFWVGGVPPALRGLQRVCYGWCLRNDDKAESHRSTR